MGRHGLLCIIIMEGCRLMEQPSFQIIWVTVPWSTRELWRLEHSGLKVTCHCSSHSLVGTNHKASANYMRPEGKEVQTHHVPGWQSADTSGKQHCCPSQPPCRFLSSPPHALQNLSSPRRVQSWQCYWNLSVLSTLIPQRLYVARLVLRLCPWHPAQAWVLNQRGVE